jgi:hypothetical protein
MDSERINEANSNDAFDLQIVKSPDAGTVAQDYERAAAASRKFSLMTYGAIVQRMRFDTIAAHDEHEHFEWSKNLSVSQAKVLDYLSEYLAHGISSKPALMADVASEAVKEDIRAVDKILDENVGANPSTFEGRRTIIREAAQVAAFTKHGDGGIFDRSHNRPTSALNDTHPTIAMSHFLLAPNTDTSRSLPLALQKRGDDLPPQDAKTLVETIDRVQQTLLNCISSRTKVFNSDAENVEQRLYLIGNDLDALDDEVEIIDRWISHEPTDQTLTEFNRKTASMHDRFSVEFPGGIERDGSPTVPAADQTETRKRERENADAPFAVAQQQRGAGFPEAGASAINPDIVVERDDRKRGRECR